MITAELGLIMMRISIASLIAWFIVDPVLGLLAWRPGKRFSGRVIANAWLIASVAVQLVVVLAS